MISDFYLDEFSVIRIANTKDSGGAIIETRTPDSTNSGYLEQLSMNKQIVNEKHEIQANYRLYCDTSVDILTTDEILIDGEYYDIYSIGKLRLGSNTHKEVLLLLEK